jgi:hypothetical protein
VIAPLEDFDDNLFGDVVRRAIEDIFSGTNMCHLKGIIIEIDGYLYPLLISFDYSTRQIFVSRAIGG